MTCHYRIATERKREGEWGKMQKRSLIVLPRSLVTAEGQSHHLLRCQQHHYDRRSTCDWHPISWCFTCANSVEHGQLFLRSAKAYLNAQTLSAKCRAKHESTPYACGRSLSSLTSPHTKTPCLSRLTDMYQMALHSVSPFRHAALTRWTPFLFHLCRQMIRCRPACIQNCITAEHPCLAAMKNNVSF